MIIVVPGAGVDKKGNVSEEAERRLLKAKELHEEHQTPILLCGKHSFLCKENIPPVTEARAMRSFLLKMGVNENQIHLEEDSKDTVGNAYYAKINYFIPNKETEAFVVTSDFHLERVRYVFQKVFGEEYGFQFISVPSPQKEERVIKRQEYLLEKMRSMMGHIENGDHISIGENLYNHEYYKEERPDWVKNFAIRGKA